jgi:hypothetical protein
MKSLVAVLFVLTLLHPNLALAGGRGTGAHVTSGTVVVGGAYGHGPRGGYYGPRYGYYGPGWRPYGPRVGVYFGAPLGWGWPWGPPAYYPPPVVYPPVVAVPPPVVYVEKGETSGAAVYGSGESLEAGYWYYCREQGAYYPAVTQCPGVWEKVAPASDQ